MGMLMSSVDYNAVSTVSIPYVHNYLMIKNMSEKETV